MQRSQLSEQVVKDVVRHLFDPQSPSRSATRALISPTLVLDFPLLPPAHEVAAAVAPPAAQEAVLKRHSPSAQALSLFRLPGFVVNHLQGSEWTLEFDYVRNVSSQDLDAGDNFQLPPGAVRWRASIAWSLTLRSPLHLPGGLEETLVLHRQDSREVELVFSPSESDVDKKLRLAREIRRANEPSGSRPRDPPGDDPDVHLVRVRYTGLHFPPYLNRFPLHDTVANYIPYLFAFLLGPLYGILLLLGLDHSTRSLDASRKRRLRLEKKKARLAKKERIIASEGKGKGKEKEVEVDAPRGKGKEKAVAQDEVTAAHSPVNTLSNRSPITSDSDDGSDLTAASLDGDGMVLESRYHRLMRQGHTLLQTIRAYRNRTASILHKTSKEVGLVQSFVRRTVVVAAEGGLTVAGVGADLLTEAGLDFGEDPERSKKMRQMEQARQGIHRRSRTLSKPEPAPMPDEPPSVSTWTNRSSPGKKRVSFSFEKQAKSAIFDPPRSPLGPGDPPTPDSAFSKFRAELDKGSSAARVDEEESETERYSPDFGLPEVVTNSPLVPDFSQAVHDTAVAAQARRGSFDKTYSAHNLLLFGDAPRIQTDPSSEDVIEQSPSRQSSHDHVDTPIPTPVDESALSPFTVPDSTTFKQAGEVRAGTSDVEQAAARRSSITPPRSPLATSMISPPSASRPLPSSVLASTPIAEAGEDAQEEEGTTSSLGVFLGPQDWTEHVKSAEEAAEQDEMREVDELLGVPATEQPTASTSSLPDTTVGDREDAPSSTTLAAADPLPAAGSISASDLAAAENFFYSPTSTEVPLLSPEISFTQSLAQDPTARGRQDSATSIPYPPTPSDSPEMHMKRTLYPGEGDKGASAGVAHSASPKEEQARVASGSMARSESMASSVAAGSDSVLGDDEGKDSGVKEKKAKSRKPKGRKKGAKKSEIGGA